MATLNNCRFIGRVGGKPEIKQMNNGKEAASFSLAIDQSYKKDEEKISKTEWIKISVFNEGIINLLKNHDMVLLSDEKRAFNEYFKIKE